MIGKVWIGAGVSLMAMMGPWAAPAMAKPAEAPAEALPEVGTGEAVEREILVLASPLSGEALEVGNAQALRTTSAISIADIWPAPRRG